MKGNFCNNCWYWYKDNEDLPECVNLPKFHEPIYTSNDEPTHEDHLHVKPDKKNYEQEPYIFMPGPNFGCVHWKSKD